MEGVARQHEHRAAFQPRQSRDDRTVRNWRPPKERALVDDGVDDRASSRPDGGCAAPPSSATSARSDRRLAMVGGNCRPTTEQEAPGAFEGFFFGFDGMVDGSVVWISAPPSSCFVKSCPRRFTTGGPATNIAEFLVMMDTWRRAAPRQDRRRSRAPIRPPACARLASCTSTSACCRRRPQIGRACFDGLHRAAAA